jgi:hypothetical protein
VPSCICLTPAPTEHAYLQAVGGGLRGAGPVAQGTRRSRHDVLAKYNGGFGEAVEEPVVDHGLRALGGLHGGLEHGHQRAAPRIGSLRQERRHPHEAGGVHVVAAGVRDRPPRYPRCRWPSPR